ncbi:hypothetical protein Pla86_34140 [Planctomycetes bacterium Pla86]|uniref:Uncharacterized protein n=1 Tax=Engelhardtia mirabilis TaxID=2528011 RepID=A0A518BMV8_9BACT|nr:hypothetical protein Pla133_34150 [Planctomycetes bacterium Pla133]QDV02645.1 hypothetical protein Pla86_34140 [Planctomycetes bacterium Pla86]
MRALGEQVRGARAVDDRWTSRNRRNHLVLLSCQQSAEWGGDPRVDPCGADPCGAAAEALASDLGRALLRVDSGAVAACWDESVQQALAELLYTAEVEGAVLLFIGAERLFGLASDVVDGKGRAVDVRHTDPLSRIFEDFGGLTILASTLPEEFGPEVARSLDLIVELGGGAAAS